MSDTLTRGRRIMRRLVANDDLQDSPLPDGHTAALPGTEEKVRVMTERARRRRCLHHPLDLSIGDLRAMGYSFTVGANGTPVWFRPAAEI